jgi:hypothetical protein
MANLTCIACQNTIYRGQRAIVLEFGTVAQSEKSGRDVVKEYASDTIHFECIQTYLGNIDGEMYEAIMKYHKTAIRREVVEELREELRQEVMDEVIDTMGRTCAVCNDEIKEMGAEDDDRLVQTAKVTGPPPPMFFPAPPLDPPLAQPPIPSWPYQATLGKK